MPAKLSTTIDSISSIPIASALNVTNRESRTLSVIDGSTNNIKSTIKFSTRPEVLAVNPSTNIIYILHTQTNTVSLVSGSTNSIILQTIFRINPTNSGDIYCTGKNGEQKISSTYVTYPLGMNLTCRAMAHNGYAFSSWSSGSISSNSTNPLKFLVSRYGSTFTATFVPVLTLDQYESLIVAYLAIVGPISAISTVVGLIFKNQQKQRLKRYMTEISCVL